MLTSVNEYHHYHPVYLVGAGPGDPGLLTLRGAELLRRAEVVIYDYLAHPDLLKLVPPGAELIYVGKMAGQHAKSQAEINHLLVERGRTGRVVVRLKGGDPYIFGRGGEEAEYLVQNGLDFEVVPGISSTIGAAAYAGIPLTHRGRACQVVLATGHEDPGKPESAHDWAALAKIDTLAFVMGVKNLPDICRKLIERGKPEDTPAALVRWGTTGRQAVLTGTLATLPELARLGQVAPPALLVIGQVVGLSSILNWFERRPLQGKKVMVTRSREQASELSARLRELGAQVIEEPTIVIGPPEDWAALDQALAHLDNYDWLVFTSPNGARIFMERLWAKGQDARALGRLKVAAIGPGTDKTLHDFGLRADLMGQTFVAEGLLKAFSDLNLAGQRFLLPRAAETREALAKGLTDQGAQVTEVAVYKTRRPENLSPEALAALDTGLDLVTFTSSSTASNLADLLGPRLKEFQALVPAVSIGPITSQTARDLGFRLLAEAGVHTINGLIAAMLELNRPGAEAEKS